MTKRPKPKPLPSKPWITRGKSTVEFTDAGLDAVRLMAASGMGQRMIASRLGIAYSTLTKKIANDETVKLAWEAGFAENEWELVSNLQRDAEGGFSAASMFLLKTRHFYNENSAPPTMTNNILITLPAPMSEEDYAKTLALPAPKPQEVEVLETVVPQERRSLVR